MDYEELYRSGKINKAQYYMNRENHPDDGSERVIIIAGKNSNIINVGDKSNVILIKNLVVSSQQQLQDFQSALEQAESLEEIEGILGQGGLFPIDQRPVV